MGTPLVSFPSMALTDSGAASMVLSAVGLLAVLVLLITLSARFRTSPVAQVPGPPPPSWIYGNMLQFKFPNFYGEHELEWLKAYGPVYRIKGVFGEDRLMISDPAALQFILNNRAIVRAPAYAKLTKLLMGEGSVLSIEGEYHRRLRAGINPAFSASVVRSFSDIFSDISQRIVHELDKSCTPGLPALINMTDLLDRGTLDIICEAALGSPFNTVANPKHPLAESHLNVLSAGFSRSKTDLLVDVILPYVPQALLVAALCLPSAAFRAVRTFHVVTDRMSAEIMREKLKAAQTDANNDMLNILIEGIASTQKKSVTASELADQIRLILLAGQDTSAATLAWMLHELAKDPEYQKRLRVEILEQKAAQGSEIDYDSMPLLNAVIKETLRMYPIGPVLERVAEEDMVIPLAFEMKTTPGEHISQLPVKKGQFIYIAIASYQKFEPLWGSDAEQFRPERWLEGNPCKGQAIGPYAQLLAFSGGFRSCAGWRFSVLEMQILLSELVANFSFALSKDDPVKPIHAAVLVPFTQAGTKGLPLLIERVSQQ